MNNKVAGYLQKLFSAITKPRRSSDIENWLPARDFEEQAGITGISAHYVFPHRLSAAEYEHRYFASYASQYSAGMKNQNPTQTEVDNWNGNPECGPVLMEQMRKGWDELVTRNPELKKVSFNREHGYQLLCAIHGAASQFNTDDINFFIKGEDTEDRTTLYQEIALTAGKRIGWIAAPETLEKIKSALEAKTGRPIGWVLLPENKEKITSHLAKKWAQPSDTAARAAEIKSLLAGPVDGWYWLLDPRDPRGAAKDMTEIKALLNKAPDRKAPKPHH